MSAPLRVVVGGLAAFLVAGAGLLLAPALDNPELDSHAADGYVQAVRIVIDNGWLVAGDDENIVRVPAEALSDADAEPFRAFYENSFLAADVARNDPGLWVIDSVLLGASPFAHVVPSPFAVSGWQGDLKVEEGPAGVEVARPNGTVLALRAQPLGAADAPISLNAFDTRQGGEGAIARLFSGRVEDGAHIADIRLIGATPVLTVAGLGPEDEVRLDGERLQAGAVRPMPTGSRLVLRRGRLEGVFVIRGRTSGALSVAQPLGGRRRNPQLEGLARAFEAAMNAVVQRSPEARDRDFEATLDIDAHRRVQQRLEAAMAGSARPAAVTVMDALSGDVLVLASTPTAQSERSPLVARASLRDRDVVNYNFQPLAVGSTAKPVIAAAILAETPGLADLEVLFPGRGPMERMLGVAFSGDRDKLPREVGQANPGEWMTLERFLAVSSNRYAGSLALLAWAREPLRADGPPAVGRDHRLGGAVPERLPRLDVQLQGGANGLRFGPAIRAPAWRRRLPALFDMGACHEAAGCRDGLWAPAFRGLPEIEDRPPDQFRAISPQDRDFGFSGIRDYRSQYLPIILGGEGYGWSTLTLAQSYARLVTGAKVEAHLLRETGVPQSTLAALPLDPGVRARLLSGLQRVVSEGTGRPLGGVLADFRTEAAQRGETIDFYAKTGTPEVEHLEFTRQEEAENRLIRERVITFDRDQMLIAGVAPIDEASRRRAVARLRANPAAMNLLGRSRPEPAVRRALQFNLATPQAKPNYFRIRRGLVVAVAPRGEAESTFTSALALVVVVRREGAGSGAPPLRAFAITINLQEAGRAALPLAQGMLRQELRRLIFPSIRPQPAATAP